MALVVVVAYENLNELTITFLFNKSVTDGLERLRNVTTISFFEKNKTVLDLTCNRWQVSLISALQAFSHCKEKQISAKVFGGSILFLFLFMVAACDKQPAA